jgi:hypothetical protein
MKSHKSLQNSLKANLLPLSFSFLYGNLLTDKWSMNDQQQYMTKNTQQIQNTVTRTGLIQLRYKVLNILEVL